MPRGDWVNDPDGGYVSDYDLLVVVSHEKLTEVLEYWAKAEDHLMREYAIDHRLTAPVNFIVHSLTDVNTRLKKGRPSLKLPVSRAMMNAFGAACRRVLTPYVRRTFKRRPSPTAPAGRGGSKKNAPGWEQKKADRR